MYISKITVDEGPKYKRWRPRARGAAYEIQKKTSHVTLILNEIEKKPKKAKKVKKRKEKKLKIEMKKPPKIEKPPKEAAEAAPTGQAEIEKPKPRPEIEIPKPKITRGLKRIFRRKAF